MSFSITVEINSSEFHQSENFIYLVMKDVFLKYGFSILTHEQNERLVFLAKEFSTLNNYNILAFNACYTLEEILYLNNELYKYNLSLDTVYIPSEERIKSRIQKAIDEQKSWGYREGITEEEIERNFINFRADLEEIKTGLSNTRIKVEAV